MATNYGIIGGGPVGNSVWTGREYTPGMREESRTWVANEWSGGRGADGVFDPSMNRAFNPDGTYDASDARRNRAVYAAGRSMGLTDAQIAETLGGVTAEQVATFGAENAASTSVQAPTFRADNPHLFEGGSGGTPRGIVQGSDGQWTGTASGAAMLGNAERWDVTPEQTVEGRIAAIIGDRNNPLQVISRTNAMETANARGLANSSMAASAGERAAYEAALPIATTDAGTFARAAGWNAEQTNQFSRANADYENQFRLTDKNAANQMALADKNNANQLTLADRNNESQFRIASMNSDTQRLVAQLNVDSQREANALQQQHQRLLETNGQAATAFNSAMNLIANINLSTTMDGEAKTRAVAEVWRDLQTQMRLLESTSGLNLTSQLNFASYPGFNEQGQWIGFGGQPPSASVARDAPPQVDGQAVNWDAPTRRGVTLRQQYDSYRQGGGTLTMDDWYRAMQASGIWQGGPGNDSSSPSSNSSSTGNTGGDTSAPGDI